ncbi:MAG TPA: ATP-dependent zinc metalloprotease FtsH [Pseudonocardia sp.]|jgi:cell division protease FtsH|uniref:ATP-dependent zinc metalloprotease FtsH n=1 Tax=Pseudonocardia sp. TaxID=60912 RepID=UPI002EDB8A53
MDRKRLLRNPLTWILAALLLYVVFSQFFDGSRGYSQVSTSVALTQISSGNVSNAVIEDKQQQLRLDLKAPITTDNGNRDQVSTTKVIAQYPFGASQPVFTALTTSKTNFNTEVQQESFLTQLLIYMVPLGLVLLLLFWMMNSAQGGGNRVLSFGKSKAKQLSKDMPKTTFADVAGADEAVEELHEIKDFLQNPGRYQALGAKIPKGVLLYGPPGTGKTLLARAVAGEAGVPFYSISGSDFVEMFVGVGASRVRDLFEQAKPNAPCIIFVDEIDAVGRQRGAGLGGGHDEREQTLNQLLVEMDGFDARGGIILIAATNRPDILDPALLRPGRFDRQIPVGAPDLAGRRAILKVHAKGKPLAPDADLDSLAKRTVGMSGADLANVINESALLTARENGTMINAASLEEAVDRVIGGPRRKSRIISEQERKLTAYHEGGHALAAWAMPDLEPVYKLTILPRGRTGGHALVVPEDDKGLMTRSEMIARLVFAMGGRSAEELVFHEPTTGASSDIDQATKIARAMVTEYGMSARLGAVRYGQEHGDPFLGRTMGNQPDYSIQVAQEIDTEVRALIEAAHTEAWEILKTYRDVLDVLVFELLEKETLTRKDLERIFSDVSKRPRITAFNDFGGRTPSDKPPIQSPAELAKERGEPWPPDREPDRQPTPVGTVGGGHKGLPSPNGGGYPSPNGGQPVPNGGPGPNGGPPYGRPAEPSYPPGTYHPRHDGSSEHPEEAVPPNYGAPPNWRPAIMPRGQDWPPAKWSGQDGPKHAERDVASPEEGRAPDAQAPDGRASDGQASDGRGTDGRASGDLNGGWSEPGKPGQDGGR